MKNLVCLRSTKIQMKWINCWQDKVNYKIKLTQQMLGKSIPNWIEQWMHYVVQNLMPKLPICQVVSADV
ncbi:hypothetical protein D3C72_1877460 [compost metagenome]